MRNILILFAYCFLLAGYVALAMAQYGLEIIPLRHRTVDQVIPILRPLLEPGGTLSGQSNQLFVRASPANVAELKRVLDMIDRPARRLQILVRFDSSRDAAAREIGASGTISNRGSRIELRAGDSSSRGGERVDQRLQVLEGGRGFIAMGQSTQFQDRATGFEVVPRVSGDTVTVDISSQRERGASLQGISTTASGRLGEWFEVGGVVTGSSRDDRGIASMSSSSKKESGRMWLKIEELRN